MKKRVLLLFFTLIILSGCSFEEQEDFQRVSLQDIEALYIDHGSNKLILESADIEALEVSLLLFDNGPGLVIDKGRNNIKISIKSDLARLFKIGRMPQLKVRVPFDFRGKMIIDGSSGSVTATDLKTESIVVTGTSGNVSLDFADFYSDVRVSTTSGNVKLFLNAEEPDVTLNLNSKSGRQSIGILLEEDAQLKKGKTGGKAGSGIHHIDIKTSSGNISVQ